MFFVEIFYMFFNSDCLFTSENCILCSETICNISIVSPPHFLSITVYILTFLSKQLGMEYETCASGDSFTSPLRGRDRKVK